VLQACDARDGVRDGVLENPTRCDWQPREILCKGPDGPDCLTQSQVEATEKVYQGAVNPRTHEPVHSPLFRGSELGWEILLGPEPLGGVGRFLPFFQYFVFSKDRPL